MSLIGFKARNHRHEVDDRATTPEVFDPLHGWQQMVEPYRDREGSPLRTEFLAGRLRFIAHDKDHVLLIWSYA